MILKDLASPPDSGGRLLLLQEDGTSDSSTSDHDSDIAPFNRIFIYIALVGLILLAVFWCVSSVRSGLATNDDVNAAASAPAAVSPQDERAAAATGTDTILQPTLVQRKNAILELFRTSQVTMVRN
jgi:hypothetical protein